jgi:hypothetical protein
MSVKPAVVKSATQVPARWMILLTPTVVPWTKWVISPSASPPLARRRSPSAMSRPGSVGVVVIVVTTPLSLSTAAKSANVPLM